MVLDPVPVKVEWHDMTAAEQTEHRQECPDLCAACEPFREFGECPACGPDQEATVDGDCLFCGWGLIAADPRDHPEWWSDQ